MVVGIAFFSGIMLGMVIPLHASYSVPYADLIKMGFSEEHCTLVPAGLTMNDAVAYIVKNLMQKPPAVEVSLSIEGRLSYEDSVMMQEIQKKIYSQLPAEVFSKFGLTFKLVPQFHITFVSLSSVNTDRIPEINRILHNVSLASPIPYTITRGTKLEYRGSFLSFRVHNFYHQSDININTYLRSRLADMGFVFKQASFEAHISLFKIGIKQGNGIQKLLSNAGYQPSCLEYGSLGGLLAKSLNSIELETDFRFIIDALTLSQYSPALKHKSISETHLGFDQEG